MERYHLVGLLQERVARVPGGKDVPEARDVCGEMPELLLEHLNGGGCGAAAAEIRYCSQA